MAIKLSKTQVSYDSQVFAFRWYQNFGDALFHFCHFASFISENQRQEALDIIKSYDHPTLFNEELSILKENVLIAPINPNKPSLILKNNII